MTDFYRTLAQVSFTILGLWIVVVQLNWKDWDTDPERRLGARLVTAHFMLPGVMSLLSLADQAGVVWRVGFAVLAVLGATGSVLLGSDLARSGSLAHRVMHWAGVWLYAVIGLVALFADPLAAAVRVDPLQVEAILLSVLMLVSLNMVFTLLFRTQRADDVGEQSHGA